MKLLCPTCGRRVAEVAAHPRAAAATWRGELVRASYDDAAPWPLEAVQRLTCRRCQEGIEFEIGPVLVEAQRGAAKVLARRCERSEAWRQDPDGPVWANRVNRAMRASTFTVHLDSDGIPRARPTLS